VVVFVSSPYDVAMVLSIGTYICRYDSKETALIALVQVLCKELSPLHHSPEPKISSFLTVLAGREWNEEHNANALDTLIQSITEGL